MQFSIKFTVYEICCFFIVFDIIFLNRNKSILVNDTLNLITHSIKEIKLSLFFIRDTFFYLTHRLRDITSFLGTWLSKTHKIPYFELPLKKWCQFICF